MFSPNNGDEQNDARDRPSSSVLNRKSVAAAPVNLDVRPAERLFAELAMIEYNSIWRTIDVA
jgi:hypothetical protein